MSTLIPSDFEFEESVYHDHSPGTSSWELDVNVGAIFRNLSVNMVSTSHLEDEKLIQLDTDPWMKHLNTLREIALSSVSHPQRIKWYR